MKRLMISTALATLVATAAMAQDNPFRAESDPLEIHASEFIGKRVYASEAAVEGNAFNGIQDCLLYTSPSPRDRTRSRMPSSA